MGDVSRVGNSSNVWLQQMQAAANKAAAEPKREVRVQNEQLSPAQQQERLDNARRQQAIASGSSTGTVINTTA